MASSLWLLWAFLSLLTYAFWGVFNGLASRHLDANTVLFCSAIGYLTVGILAIALLDFKPVAHFSNLLHRGAGYGFLVGLATGLGGLFLLISLHKGGNPSVVVALTSIYPLATIAFNILFLHDSMSIRQSIGAALSVCGVILLLIR